MRLTSIRIAGFKSFVDPTHLPLPSNRTAVVGPNGCGKSNIIDAVRWVLGETSIKNLRAAEAEDVIFNGSKSRKLVARASVELVFDNSDQKILGAYAAYTDIAIRRELTRDGNSQYFLNGKKCLKRDVTDLFLGTGLGGKNQYAIIEQGMVSRMVEAKPEDLRHWLEEAAGISKYKERRKETESRMRQTRDNLLRLEDVRTELQQRLDVLTKQAANAKKFKECKVEERQLKAELLALRIRNAQQVLTGREATITRAEVDFNEARQRVIDTLSARQAAEALLQEAQHRSQECQAGLYEAEAAYGQQDQVLRHARELRALKERELSQLQRQAGELGERLLQTDAKQTSLQRDAVELAAALQAAEQAEVDAAAATEEAEIAAEDAEAAWDAQLAAVQAPVAQLEGARVRLQQLQRSLQMGEERARRLQQELQSLPVAALRQSVEDAVLELAALQEANEDAEVRHEDLLGSVAAQREARTLAEASLHAERQRLQTLRGRVASLETLQQAALRQDDRSLGDWLQQRALHQSPRLASVMQVDAGWEAAIEAVLGDVLHAPVTPSWQALWDAGGPDSGIAVLSDAAMAPTAAGDSLASKVRGPQALLHWLASVRCADDAENATAALTAIAPGESVITPDGVWRFAHGLRWPRQGGSGTGVIARAKLLKDSHADLEALQAAVLQQESSLESLRARQSADEAALRAASQQLQQLRQRVQQKQAYHQSQKLRWETAETRAAQLQAELTALEEQGGAQRNDTALAETEVRGLELSVAALQRERELRQLALAKARDAVMRSRQAQQSARAQLGQWQSKLAQQQAAVAALAQSRADLTERQASLVAQLDAQAGAVQADSAPLDALEQSLQDARTTLERAKLVQRGAREQQQQAEASLQTAQKAAFAADGQQDAQREALQAARLAAEGERVRVAQLQEQFAELDQSLETVLQGLSADASLPVWEERSAALQRRIDRLGAINLAAIEELDEAEQRASFLHTQREDLNNALLTLEAAMAKIDAETHALFRTTFDKVNSVFIDRFPKLFGGGEAYLELTGEHKNDLALNPEADWGVRVMARPPGKRNSTIHLLSGGEKAMTAVALLLALFQLNPAPFCLMDEVDAPLDDANVGRFCGIVKEMSDTVQFIIITHNKITMELAQQLHGVTMQEPGVSRLVSVDLDQAVELTASENASDPQPVSA